MSLSEALHSVRFRTLQPLRPAPKILRPFLTHGFRTVPWICEHLNTVAPFLGSARRKALRRASFMRKMSTFAVGAVINECVRRMPDDSCYLNIGTWRGFSLFAGMAENPTKHCIGVDSFVEFGGPRKSFFRRFQTLKSDRHEFFESDWREYMTRHTEKIGVFFYDAAHDEKSQFDALVIADPFIVPDGIMIIDDTNWSGASDAVKAFLSHKKNYRLLFEQLTADNCHPTFWNGISVIQKCS